MLRRILAATGLAGALMLTGAAPSAQPAAPSELTLWYRAPASPWVAALPVGNGRLGAMVFGGVTEERLQLNEDTLWAGRPYDPVNPEAKNALPRVRRLLAERKYAEAAQLADASVMSKPLAQMPYQTVGDLALTFPNGDAVDNYRRDLDLTTATAHTSYTSGGVSFSREVFA